MEGHWHVRLLAIAAASSLRAGRQSHDRPAPKHGVLRTPTLRRRSPNRSFGRKRNTLVGRPVFMLDVVGRSSGESRPVMLMYVPRGDDLIVVGSGGGRAKTPNWYKNLMAAGGADVQVGGDRWSVAARELADGAERDECWALATAVYSGFDSYQTFTDRTIPVAVLTRLPSGP